MLPAESAPGDGVMDLVFAIDASKNLGPANFELSGQFVISMVEALDVSHTLVSCRTPTEVGTEIPPLSQRTSAEGVGQPVSRLQCTGRGSMAEIRAASHVSVRLFWANIPRPTRQDCVH